MLLRKLTLLVLGLICLLPSQADIRSSVLEKINLYNLRSVCWGEAANGFYNLQLHNAMVACGTVPASLDHEVRRKRDVTNYDLHMDADVGTYRESLESKVENLMCVLKEFKWLNAAGEMDPTAFSVANLQKYTTTPAGSDPVWLNKFSNAMTNCYNIAMSWPASALKDNALLAKHGRKMVYFKCLKKTEINMCAKFEMAGYIAATTGEQIDPATYNAVDKYDAAAMAIEVAEEASSKEYRHVDKFFWGNAETMFEG